MPERCVAGGGGDDGIGGDGVSERDQMYRAIAALASMVMALGFVTWLLCLGRLLRWCF